MRRSLLKSHRTSNTMKNHRKLINQFSNNTKSYPSNAGYHRNFSQYFILIFLTLLITLIIETTANKWDVLFRLYTDENYGLIITVNSDNLNKTDFNPINPTKIIVHGYDSSAQNIYLVNMRQEYAEKGNYNIITVDYNERSSNGTYFAVYANHAPHVGHRIAEIIMKIRQSGAKDIHLIGFSLGCHVIGYTADRLKPYKVPRITGLDPSTLILTGAWNIKSQLRVSNADFVDVYHTNMGVQGSWEGLGDIDVYMNGGVRQPGCGLSSQCDHHRAIEYFTESINSKIGFWGKKCPNWFAGKFYLLFCRTKNLDLLGDPVNLNTRGLYFVKTNSEKPYAKNYY